MTSPVLPDGLYPVLPHPEGLDDAFWEGTRREEIRIQRCEDCRGFQWLPEWVCYHCHSLNLSFEPVLPSGTIYSWERVWHPPTPELAPYCPYIIAVIQLDSAPSVRVVGNLIGGGEQVVTIGAPVNAVFEHHERYTLVQWSAAG